jgi:ferredoxin/flavodoxin---NADP+ reductase
VDIPGEQLRGNCAAADFVPGTTAIPITPTTCSIWRRARGDRGERQCGVGCDAVVVSDPETLAATDMADHALTALADSNIREVVILARR